MSQIVNTYDMGLILATQDEYGFYEPQWGDPDYDYGITEDGYIIPTPCIIDGVPMNSCKGTND